MSGKEVLLEIRNFGPVVDGLIEIKPLTIFVGPNNTGKSYIAMLYYALIRGLRETILSYTIVRRYRIPLSSSIIFASSFARLTQLLSDESKRISLLMRRNSFKDLDQVSDILYTSFEEKILPVLCEIFSERLRTALENEIERTFSSRIGELIRRGSRKSDIRLSIRGSFSEIIFTLDLLPHEKLNIDLVLNISDKNRFREIVRKYVERSLSIYVGKNISSPAIRRILVKIIGDFMLEIFPNYYIHYLPASRAGILHSYKAVARAIISQVPLVLIRRLDVPKISGPIADFLSNLVELTPELEKSRVNRFFGKFEKDILEGKISLVRERPESPPSLVYESNGERIPIVRTSSMIAELAPLSIFLKYGLISKGDTIILEEPESHLHPDKQIKLVEFLVKLVNRFRINMIITTHSDIMLAKLGNLVSLNSFSDEELRKMNYSRDETISPKDIAVYNFCRRDSHVVIEPIEITYKGIPDNVFRKIIENLYEETMDIYYRLQKIRSKE